MKRDIYDHLVEWKAGRRRKPLLLRGARQTGKTYILKEFGEKEYENLFYFNFEEDQRLAGFFSENLKPANIIENLSAFTGKKIRSASDLIFFDEIQSSNGALNSLKYFAEEADDFHIVAAGSLLGVKLSLPKSFPVGKVDFLDLYPMTFLEFLTALDKAQYREMLERLRRISPLPEPIHNELITLLRKYYFIGGMPEAVRCYSEEGDTGEVKKIHAGIINSYEPVARVLNYTSLIYHYAC